MKKDRFKIIEKYFINMTVGSALFFLFSFSADIRVSFLGVVTSIIAILMALTGFFTRSILIKVLAVIVIVSGSTMTYQMINLGLNEKKRDEEVAKIARQVQERLNQEKRK